MRDLVPDDFGAYVRILFPFYEPREDSPVLDHLITWHETAIRNGRQPHRLMDVVGIGPEHRDALHGGTHAAQILAANQETALQSILEAHTSSEHSWFLLWQGDYHGGVVFPEASLIDVDQGPSSRYCVFNGAHKAWRDFWTYPRWWWPEDRACCWQTSLDPDMTNCAYLGASHECIEAIFADPGIEAVIAHPDDDTFSSDTINRGPF